MNLKTVNARLISVWESNIESMPAEIRAGPWFVIAETQLRMGESQSSTINFLRIPILYPTSFDLSAAALYQAGQLLKNAGSQTESKTICDELKQKFPQSIWAEQVSK
jgi:TolA-binding protein